MEPAARAALTATLIMGCRLGDINFEVKSVRPAGDAGGDNTAILTG
jgi:hypothetical protein